MSDGKLDGRILSLSSTCTLQVVFQVLTTLIVEKHFFVEDRSFSPFSPKIKRSTQVTSLDRQNRLE